MPPPVITFSDPGTSPGDLSPDSGAGGSIGGFAEAEIQGVCIAFNSPALTDEPVWTRIDDPAGSFIVQSYEIHRGRQSELDRTEAGRATVNIVDDSGYFDPSTGASYLNPLKPAAIGLFNPVLETWHTIFRGHVSKWSYDLYQNETYANVVLELVDGQDIIARTEMTPSPIGEAATAFGDVIVPETNGDIVYYADDQVKYRIDQVLDEVGWPIGLREIFTGNVALQESVYSPRTSALTVIDEAADGEFPSVANFYIQKNGKATFHGRQARFRPEVAEYNISIWRAGDEAAVAADSTRAIIFDLDYDVDEAKIINNATSTPFGIAARFIENQRVTDAASIADYGHRSWSAENLRTAQDYFGATTPRAATKKFAEYYAQNYAQPRTRVNSITFKRVEPTHTWGDREWRVLCNVDISDIIRLKTTHHDGTLGFDEDFYVEGIHYSVQPLSDEYLDAELTLDLSPTAYYTTDTMS